MTSDASLQAAYDAKGSEYQPRTRHLDADGQPRFINRLIHEEAPYLLQHAHNPVDWFPWGEEAFAKARAENKPVFLSIGYATCHWCHVMEHESFEDFGVAERLNRDFVAIKVDREMHPDVDETYMRALLLITGQGGWPMSSFLTPEGQSFFAGTYYPPARFADLLAQIADHWRNQPSEVLKQAERINQALALVHVKPPVRKPLPKNAGSRAVRQCMSLYDRRHGGFSPAPKFPHEPLLLFLLDQLRRQPREQVLHAVVHSLEVMARGGIHDHIGGGFHRYSTDDHWLVPHFEKMLYNQAQLARVYVQAWQLTGQASFRRTGEDILDDVLREMTDRHGRFHSATDADSEGAEGTFFVWTPAQIDAALAADDADWIKQVFGITQAGNFDGRSIPFLTDSLETLAERDGQPLDAVLTRFARCREQLRLVREQRAKPLCDDKIIVAWNGLMITALAEASRLLGRADYGAAAQRAADALWQGNRCADGGLLRIAKGDKAWVRASLEDYADFAEACLQLHDLSAAPLWLERAQVLCDEALHRFGDGDGGFYLSEADAHPAGMGRSLDLGHDNATPSGSGVLLQVLAQLGQRCEQPHYRQQAEVMLARVADKLTSAPHHGPSLMSGAEMLNHGRCDSLAFAASGRVRLVASRSDAQRVALELTIAAGLHLNAATGLDITLDESDWRLVDARLPAPRPLTVAFQDEPLLAYAGQLRIELILDAPSSAPLTRLVPIRAQLQACTDQICLPAETVRLVV